jgi:hypothetical protein
MTMSLHPRILSILWPWNTWWVSFLWNLPETCRETWFWVSSFASKFGMSLCCLLVSCFSLFLPLFLAFFLSLAFSFFISLCMSLFLFILLSLLLSFCLVSHSVCVSLQRYLSETFTLFSFKISHTRISFPCFRGSSLDVILRFNSAFPCKSSALSCVLVHDVCAHTFSFSCVSYALTGSLFHLRNSPADVSGSSWFYWPLEVCQGCKSWLVDCQINRKLMKAPLNARRWTGGEWHTRAKKKDQNYFL